MHRIVEIIKLLGSISFALVSVGCSDLPPPTNFPPVSDVVGFSAASDIAVGRFLHASVALPDGRVIISGGFVGPGQEAQTSVEIFTPSANLWAGGPTMKDPRYAHQVVALPDGRILAMGGQNLSGYLATAEILDINKPSSTWEKTNPMRESRIHFTATAINSENIVLIAGGVSDVLGRSEWFAGATAQWLPEGMPQPMLQSRSYHASVRLQSGAVLVAGGLAQIDADPEIDYLDTTELFDPATGTWTATGSMRTPRATYTLTLLPDGRAIAVGGTTDNGVALSSAEVYDPISGSWTETEPMANARTGHQATVLVGGRRLLVTGGYGDVTDPIAVAEILDIKTMQWAPAGNLVAPRFLHTAHLVESDGRVLLVGGVDREVIGTPATVRKTELFTPPCASNLECVEGHYCAVEGVCVPNMH
ncbi:MAG TPA: kelch repeat-containing protein [Cyclobacteriaceae bacterium]|nr:kelch repeat-containing protein [Cyclobacteriaceae bacterium]